MGHFIEEAKSLREQQQNNSSAYLRGFNKSFLALGGLFRAALQVSFITYAMMQNIVPLRCKHLRLPAIFCDTWSKGHIQLNKILANLNIAS